MLVHMKRTLTPELMDDPDLDPREHHRALAGLARLNRLSRAADILWPTVRGCAERNGGSVSLLDLATGSGDLPIELGRRARKAGISLSLSACDISQTALDVVKHRAADASLDIDCFVHDIIQSPISQSGPYDLVTCSLFLHHLDDASAVTLLRHAASACSGTLLVSDLRRDRVGLMLAWVSSRLFTRSHIVHIDAVKSVHAAFTPQEMRQFANEAGLQEANIRSAFPRRMLLSWSPS